MPEPVGSAGRGAAVVVVVVVDVVVVVVDVVDVVGAVMDLLGAVGAKTVVVVDVEELVGAAVDDVVGTLTRSIVPTVALEVSDSRFGCTSSRLAEPVLGGEPTSPAAESVAAPRVSVVVLSTVSGP